MSIDINEELKKIDESRNWVEFMKQAPCEKLKKTHNKPVNNTRVH